MHDAKAHSQARFGRFAGAYVASAVHAQGADLDLLLDMAAPQPGWLALDIATGGGHTALRLAPHLRAVIAIDLTPAMLEAARRFHVEQGARAIAYALADAERLPFREAAFDLVTCRIAAHHFPDPFRFVCESARVLKPGGLLVVQDQIVPDDERAADYVNAFEKLRDPSHQRAFPIYAWEGMLLDAGLAVERSQHIRRNASLLEWARMQAVDEETLVHLHVLLAQAPKAAAEWLNPRCVGTADASFDHHHLLIAGRKPAC